jgi:hypothetical protein
VRTPAATFVGRFAAATPRRLDSLVVTLQNLEPLTGPASYRFYAVTTTGTARPVAARLTQLRTDSTVTAAGTISTRVDSSEAGTSSFLRGTPGNTVVRARFPGAQFGDTTSAFLVVTIEADSATAAYTPATPKPLWLRYRAGGANPALPAFYNVSASGSSLFGNFDPTAPFLFSPLGRGRSAFWDRYKDGKLLYSGIAENLTQPPVGYYYQPWLRDTRARRAMRFGELRDFSGNSLRDADLRPITSSVAQLPFARFGTSEDSVGVPLNTFEAVHLVLEPKLGADTTHALTSVLVGVIGDTLGLRGLGTVRVTVTRGGQPLAGATVIITAAGSPYLVGRGNAIVTEATGVREIDRIPAGEVEVRVVPPSGITAPSAPTRVTVVRQQVTQVTVVVP